MFISEGCSKGRAGSLTPNGKNLKLEPPDDTPILAQYKDEIDYGFISDIFSTPKRNSTQKGMSSRRATKMLISSLNIVVKVVLLKSHLLNSR